MSKANSFLLDTPTHVRDGAIAADLMKGLRNEVTKKRKNGSHAFEMMYRSKKEIQSLYLEKTAVKKLIHANSRSDFSQCIRLT